ncbi:Longiborneol synthase [Mycena venus]|uniref:Longiborneol synthase n=1 Tax=Mycena venus TaxID=2733690 RepID=A0A8H7DBQ4_9AGAR|nr:Longiborneol synthase [Mycena venus]
MNTSTRKNAQIGHLDAEDIKMLVESLLHLVSYKPSCDPQLTRDSIHTLENALRQEIVSWNADDGLDGDLFEFTTKRSAALSEFFYSRHTFEDKLVLALYTWEVFFFYIDDKGSKLCLEEYQRLLLLGRQPEDRAMARFQELLAKFYDIWDPVCANLMFSGALEFVNGNILERRENVCEMDVRALASPWPKYWRTKSGGAPGFSAGIFPKENHPDITKYIQALPDIDDYVGLVNDILSFYKEQSSGETSTYVHVRARTTLKHPREVLAEMVAEVGELHARISSVLEGYPAEFEAWMAFANGSIGLHLTLERYKLSEIGFPSL